MFQLVQIDERSAAHLEQTNQAQMLRLREQQEPNTEEVPPLVPVVNNINIGGDADTANGHQQITTTTSSAAADNGNK